MTKEDHIAYWLKSAEKDWDTLEYLLNGKKYVHALFFGHLYVEKLSKALWIKHNVENYPPKIHNTLRILQKANVELREDHQVFLLKLDQYQIEGRYPEDVDALYRITNETLTREYLDIIKTIAQWIHDKLQ